MYLRKTSEFFNWIKLAQDGVKLLDFGCNGSVHFGSMISGGKIVFLR
jgi:hypothetical protein